MVSYPRFVLIRVGLASYRVALDCIVSHEYCMLEYSTMYSRVDDGLKTMLCYLESSCLLNQSISSDMMRHTEMMCRDPRADPRLMRRALKKLSYDLMRGRNMFYINHTCHFDYALLGS